MMTSNVITRKFFRTKSNASNNDDVKDNAGLIGDASFSSCKCAGCQVYKPLKKWGFDFKLLYIGYVHYFHVAKKNPKELIYTTQYLIPYIGSFWCFPLAKHFSAILAEASCRYGCTRTDIDSTWTCNAIQNLQVFGRYAHAILCVAHRVHLYKQKQTSQKKEQMKREFKENDHTNIIWVLTEALKEDKTLKKDRAPLNSLEDSYELDDDDERALKNFQISIETEAKNTRTVKLLADIWMTPISLVHRIISFSTFFTRIIFAITSPGKGLIARVHPGDLERKEERFNEKTNYDYLRFKKVNDLFEGQRRVYTNRTDPAKNGQTDIDTRHWVGSQTMFLGFVFFAIVCTLQFLDKGIIVYVALGIFLGWFLILSVPPILDVCDWQGLINMYGIILSNPSTGFTWILDYFREASVTFSTVLVFNGTVGLFGYIIWYIIKGETFNELVRIFTILFSIKFILLPSMDIYWGWAKLKNIKMVIASGDPGSLGATSVASVASLLECKTDANVVVMPIRPCVHAEEIRGQEKRTAGWPLSDQLHIYNSQYQFITTHKDIISSCFEKRISAYIQGIGECTNCALNNATTFGFTRVITVSSSYDTIENRS